MEAKTHELIHALLPHVAYKVERLLMNTICLKSQPLGENKLPLGTSKLGGSPDLPPGVGWPEWKGEPLSFIGQFRMPDVTEYDAEGVLPRSGMLYFFYSASQETWGFDPADRGSWRVLYADVDSSKLVRTSAPATLLEDGNFSPCALTYGCEVTLPSLYSADMNNLELTEQEIDAYSELTDQLAVLRGEGKEPIHQMLGHPLEIQGTRQLQCQLVSNGIYCGDPSGYEDPRVESLKQGVTDWRLLLQIDSDDNAGMMWGDAGKIYYWIRQQDLQARDFDNVWMLLQCY